MVRRTGYMRLLLALFLSFWPLTARAAGGLTLGAACSNADDNSAHASISTFQYVRCSGGVWVLQSLQPGAATDACAAAAAGEIQWTGAALQYCNGASWASLSAGGNPALSSLIAATAGNTIANAANAQVWNWDTLTTGTALKIASTSMTTGSLLNLSNTHTTGTGIVLSVTTATTGGAKVIQAYANGTTGGNTGVFAQVDSTDGNAMGVWGYVPAAAGTGTGVMGRSDSTAGGVGVWGWAPSATGVNIGVSGRTDSTTAFARGVDGLAIGATGATYGVYGTGASATGAGGYFTNTNGGYALVTGSGNVGIGTTTPANTLDVAGTVKLGSAGTAMTAMGVCTVASYTPSNSFVTDTCTGVPASTSVAVNCSPVGALSSASDTINARANGTLNQIIVNTSAANANAVSLVCMWVRP